MRVFTLVLITLICAGVSQGYLAIDSPAYRNVGWTSVNVSATDAWFGVEWGSELISWWSFDEGNSTHAFDHLASNHLAVETVDGRFGSGIDTASVMEDTGVLVSPRFSVSAWFRSEIADHSLLPGPLHILSCSHVLSPNVTGFVLGIDNVSNRFFFAVYNSSVERDEHRIFSESEISGTWVHLAAVFNGSHATLFTDGVMQNISQEVGGGMYDQNCSLRIGWHGAEMSANGTIDEVLVWNRSISHDEILSLSEGAWLNKTIFLDDGVYWYMVYGNDGEGSYVLELLNATVDTVAPHFIDVISSATNDTIFLSWNASELAYATIRRDGELVAALGLSSGSSYSLGGLDEETDHEIDISLCDRAGNCNATMRTVRTLARWSIPEIMVFPQDLYNTSQETLEISCVVSDANLTNVTLMVFSNDTFVPNGTNTSGMNGTYRFLRSFPGGGEFRCQACNNNSICVLSDVRRVATGFVAMLLLSSDPGYDETNVSSSEIRLEFTLPLATGEHEVTFFKNGSAIPYWQVQNGSVLFIHPYLPLAGNATYTIMVPWSVQSVEGVSLNETEMISFTTAYPDLDGDGIPDHLDLDDDGDGIPNVNDTLRGDAGAIYSNMNLTVMVNGSMLPLNPSGNQIVSIIENGSAVVSFVHDFTEPLFLSGISIIKNVAHNSILIHGLEREKTVWLKDSDGIPSDVCVKDSAIHHISQMSEGCIGDDEVVLDCDGALRDGMRCIRDDGYLKVTGIMHSAVRERCKENWECESWSPRICAVEREQTRICRDIRSCGTTDSLPALTKACQPIFSIRRGGCLLEWDCGEWGACKGGSERRVCENIGTCPDHIKPPEFERECVVEAVGAIEEESSEEGGSLDQKMSESAETEGHSDLRRDIFSEQEEPAPFHDGIDPFFVDVKVVIIVLLVIIIILMGRYGTISGIKKKKRPAIDSPRPVEKVSGLPVGLVSSAYDKAKEPGKKTMDHGQHIERLRAGRWRIQTINDELKGIEGVKETDVLRGWDGGKERDGVLEDSPEMGEARGERELMQDTGREEALEGRALEGRTLEGRALEGRALEGRALEGRAFRGDAHVEGNGGEDGAVMQGIAAAGSLVVDAAESRVIDPAGIDAGEKGDGPIEVRRATGAGGQAIQGVHDTDTVVSRIKANRKAYGQKVRDDRIRDGQGSPQRIGGKAEDTGGDQGELREVESGSFFIDAPEVAFTKIKRIDLPPNKRSFIKEVGIRWLGSIVPKKRLKGPAALATSGMLKEFVIRNKGTWGEEEWLRLMIAVRKKGYLIEDAQLMRLCTIEQEKYHSLEDHEGS